MSGEFGRRQLDRFQTRLPIEQRLPSTAFPLAAQTLFEQRPELVARVAGSQKLGEPHRHVCRWERVGQRREPQVAQERPCQGLPAVAEPRVAAGIPMLQSAAFVCGVPDRMRVVAERGHVGIDRSHDHNRTGRAFGGAAIGQEPAGLDHNLAKCWRC